jgi:hypothetical protein
MSDKVTITQLAREKGVKEREITKDAEAMKRWFDSAREEGRHIAVEQDDGSFRGVIAWRPTT